MNEMKYFLMAIGLFMLVSPLLVGGVNMIWRTVQMIQAAGRERRRSGEGRIMISQPLVTVAVLGLIWAGAAPAAEPVRIGAFLSLSGPAAYLGGPELETLNLYIDRLNQAGGVLGRRLELTHYQDVGSSSERAQTAVKHLIQHDQVDVIIGGSTTGTTLAVLPLVEQGQTPFISLAAGRAISEPVKRWVFQVAPTDGMAVQTILADLRARGLTRIGLLAADDPFGQSARHETQTLAGQYGIAILADETYMLNGTLLLAQLQKLADTPDLQAVLCLGAGQGPVMVTRYYRQLDIPLPLYQSHGAASQEYIRQSEGAAEGVRLVAGALVVAERLPAADPLKPVLTAYRMAYEGRYQKPATPFGGHAYDALMLAVDAIRRAGTTDRQAVRDALEATRGYVGTSGVVNMSAADHLGLAPAALHLVDVRGDHWAFIHEAPPALALGVPVVAESIE